jgi:hypothetical protein
MARRTIRARRSSPYLVATVVILALLFVVAAVGWGWTWSARNEELAAAFGQSVVDRATQGDRSLFEETFNKYAEEGRRPTTLLEIIERKNQQTEEYRSDIPRLVQVLTGEVPDNKQGTQLRAIATEAIKAATDSLDAAGTTLTKSYEGGAAPADKVADVKPSNMVAAVRSLNQRVDAYGVQVKADDTKTAGLDGQLKGVQGELATAKTEHARQVEQIQSELKDERTRLTKARDDAAAVSANLQKQLTDLTDRYMAEKATWQKERSKLDQVLASRDTELKTVSHELADMKKPPSEFRIAARIISLSDQGKVAYADLGTKDGIVQGMTFSILGPNDMGKTTFEPKAQCTVVKIMQNSCQIRVDQLKADSPVLVGDMLYNPVYDRTRRLSFFLVGKMDIDQSLTDNTQQLVGMIEKYGGRVDTTLTHQTQYLILGEQPVVPAPPSASASPMERQQYEDARKRFIDYADARATAERLGVPILSLNRFIGLMGMSSAQQQ